MATRYNAKAGGLSWRDGVYRTINPASLDRADAKCSRADWGKVSEHFKDGPFPGLVLTCTPDGIASRAYCRPCGGRHEEMLDFDTTTVDEQEVCARLQPFAVQHQDCSTHPKQWQTPSILRDFANSFLRFATRDLVKGYELPAALHLLQPNGHSHSFLLPASVPRGQKRLGAIIEFRTPVRHYIRAQQLDLIAAVLTSESYYVDQTRSGAVIRRDGLMVQYVTSEYGRGFLYRIEAADVEPGQRIRRTIKPISGEARLPTSPWLDTLLA